MPLEAGRPAPRFDLLDHDGDRLTLDHLRGRKSLVVFVPFPFIDPCTDELRAIRDRLGELSALHASVVAITCATRAANHRWAVDEGFNFPVLSDYWPHGQIAKAFDAFDERRGCATRTTFALDADAVVRAVVDSGSIGIAREFAAYTVALASF
jgi:peroxiredoxin